MGGVRLRAQCSGAAPSPHPAGPVRRSLEAWVLGGGAAAAPPPAPEGRTPNHPYAPKGQGPPRRAPRKASPPLGEGETGKRGTPDTLHACRTPQRGHTTCPEQPSRTARRFISMSEGGNGPLAPPPSRAAQWREGALLPAHAIGRI